MDLKIAADTVYELHTLQGDPHPLPRPVPIARVAITRVIPLLMTLVNVHHWETSPKEAARKTMVIVNQIPAELCQFKVRMCPWSQYRADQAETSSSVRADHPEWKYPLASASYGIVWDNDH